MKATSIAQRVAGMKKRFEERLDAVSAKMDEVEKMGEQGLQMTEQFVAQQFEDVQEMEREMRALTNGAPLGSSTSQDGSNA